jgi:AcrR family transcriptional regulator
VTNSHLAKSSGRDVTILGAACRVVIREGAHGLRIASVAREAGVSKALVHYYFPTRQDLLRSAFAFSETRWEEIVAREVDALATGRERVARSLTACIDTAPPHGEYRALWTAMWTGLHGDEELRPVVRAHYRAWVDLLAARIREGQADGSIATRVEPAGAALRLAALTDGLDSMLYLGLTEPDTARESLDTAVSLELEP